MSDILFLTTAEKEEAERSVIDRTFAMQEDIEQGLRECGEDRIDENDVIIEASRRMHKFYTKAFEKWDMRSIKYTEKGDERKAEIMSRKALMALHARGFSSKTLARRPEIQFASERLRLRTAKEIEARKKLAEKSSTDYRDYKSNGSRRVTCPCGHQQCATNFGKDVAESTAWRHLKWGLDDILPKFRERCKKMQSVDASLK